MAKRGAESDDEMDSDLGTPTNVTPSKSTETPRRETLQGSNIKRRKLPTTANLDDKSDRDLILLLLNKVEKIEEDVLTLNSSVKSMDTKLGEWEQKLKIAETKTNENKEKIKENCLKITEQEKKINELEKNLDDLYCKTNENNLIIRGMNTTNPDQIYERGSWN